MKIKKPFNGLTSGEHQRLTESVCWLKSIWRRQTEPQPIGSCPTSSGAYCAKPRAAQSSVSRLDRDRPFPQADRRAFDVRFGSDSTELAKATGPFMSAVPPKASLSVPRIERTQRAKTGLMRYGKSPSLDH